MRDPEGFLRVKQKPGQATIPVPGGLGVPDKAMSPFVARQMGAGAMNNFLAPPHLQNLPGVPHRTKGNRVPGPAGGASSHQRPVSAQSGSRQQGATMRPRKDGGNFPGSGRPRSGQPGSRWSPGGTGGGGGGAGVPALGEDGGGGGPGGLAGWFQGGQWEQWTAQCLASGGEGGGVPGLLRETPSAMQYIMGTETGGSAIPAGGPPLMSPPPSGPAGGLRQVGFHDLPNQQRAGTRELVRVESNSSTGSSLPQIVDGAPPP